MTRYRWNGAGMLSSVELPDGREVHFAYDVMARRLRKRVLERQGDELHPTKEVRWSWDGHNPLVELDSEEGKSTWVFEPETFNPLAKLARGDVWGALTDQIGTPTELVGHDGSVRWRVTADLNGRQGGGAPAVGCEFGWPGQCRDVEVGFSYNRFRYFDHDVGSYVSKDPIRLHGGPRAYAYPNDPLYAFDPLALAAAYCQSAQRWRDTNTGRFRGRPSDLSELVDNGRVDFPSLMEWKTAHVDWNPALPHNQWVHSPGKFPSGGFSHDLRASNGERIRMHGHGANPSPALPPTSNAARGPTTSISRVHGGQGQQLTTSGSWAPKGTPHPNDVHIPLDNSPF